MLDRTKKYILSLLVVIASIAYVSFQGTIGNKPQYAVSTDLPSPTDTNTNISDTPNTSNAPDTPSPGTAVSGKYKDGQYTGSSADAYYGNIQVQAVIQNGKIVDVQFLDYPKDRKTSVAINQDAMQVLKQEAIQKQNANVSIVSGATDTSQAFRESLTSALSQAI